MKEYCKIDRKGNIITMPNPYKAYIINPTDLQKEAIAVLDDWLEMIYVSQPNYNPETQYVVETWVRENQSAIQHWEVKNI